MTEKELLYFEDAINHEKSIIDILNNNIASLENSNLIDFMNNQISYHQDIKEKLTILLKEKSNE